MLPMEGVLTFVPTLTVPMSVPVQLKATSWEKMNTLVLVSKGTAGYVANCHALYYQPCLSHRY